MDRLFTAIATRVSAFAGQPVAFIVAVLAIAIWGATGPIFAFSDTWQLVVNTSTTIITFLMVFVIQNAQNRDAAAIQAKLDEIIRAMDGARDDFIGIEHLTDRQLEQIRAAIERESRSGDHRAATGAGSVAKLIERF